MPTLRITFQYNNGSPLNTVQVVERIPFKTKEDGVKFLASYRVLMDRKKVNKDIIDAEWALVGIDNTDAEIIKNPHGYEGKLSNELLRYTEERGG